MLVLGVLRGLHVGGAGVIEFQTVAAAVLRQLGRGARVVSRRLAVRVDAAFFVKAGNVCCWILAPGFNVE